VVSLGRDSVAWRVASESVVVLGGGRALILQLAHPKVAAGVAEHSDYRTHPWRRILRTLDLTSKIVFGDPEASRAASEHLRAVHERVHGTDERGEAYSALDPALALWVHATLLDTSLLFYERFAGSLSAAELDAYHRDMVRAGELHGIPADLHPPDPESFRAYMAEMLASGLRVTQTTRDVATTVLDPPLPEPARTAAAPGAELLRLFTVGTLPPGLRDELGLDWGPRRERLLDAFAIASRLSARALPSALHSLPARLALAA
jgi:uncharacterized protein (DUF2236 family)